MATPTDRCAIRGRVAKRHYVLVDGILAGEGRGPLNPDPVPAGVLLFGVHPPSVDAACAYLMGFDPDKIPIVSRAFQCRKLPLADHAWRDIVVRSNDAAWNRALLAISSARHISLRTSLRVEGAHRTIPALDASADQMNEAVPQP